MTTVGIHAPSVNFETTTTIVTDAVACRSDGVDRKPARPSRLPQSPVVHDHPGLRQRERHEQTHREERDERADLTAECDEESAGAKREHQDPVREHEAIAAIGELAGQEPVGGDDAREPGEVSERGVRRQGQDRRGRCLEHPIERSVTHHGPPHDRQDRLVRAQRRSQLCSQDRDAEEQAAEDHRHPRQRDGRIARLRLAERLDPVRDRFDTAQRDRTRRERPQQQERGGARQHRVGTGEVRKRSVVRREATEIAGRDPDQSPDDEQRHHRDVRVRRRREQPARFTHTTQVRDHDQRDKTQRRGRLRDRAAARSPR